MKLNAILFLYGVLIAIACMLLGFELARIVDPALSRQSHTAGARPGRGRGSGILGNSTGKRGGQ